MASLQERRETLPAVAEEQQDTVVSFSPATDEASYVLLVLPRDEKQLNTILYEVALFNFSQFMIKDFDLKQIPMFTTGQSALQVSGFANMSEAIWYEKMIEKNVDLMQVLKDNGAMCVCITQSNFALIGKHFTLEEYLEWAQ